MENAEIQKIIEGITNSLDIKITEIVYEQTKHKDREISDLHKEIRDDIKTLKEIVQAHDEVIQELRQLYKTSGYIKKFILWFLLFVPSVAGFFAGLKYLYDLTK